MQNSDPDLAHELLSHQVFLRRLALDLVGNEADDLVQDVWQRALEHPPRHGRRLRGWLARVARNLAANRWRAEARRTEREEQRASALPAEGQLEARFELRKELVAALDALSPSGRETILLRYFEGLAPRDIARRQGIAVATVKTRLRRGLAQLREALDRRRGGERADWMPAVAALAGHVDGGLGTGTLVIGGMAVGTMMKVCAGALVAAVCVYLAARTARDEPQQSVAVAPPVDVRGPMDVEDGPALQASAPETAQRNPVRQSPPVDPAAVAGTRVLRVILEGSTEEHARHATVTLAGVEEGRAWLHRIEDAWPSQGRSSEFDLDPFFARVNGGPAGLQDDELVVVVDHPLHFSETIRVPLSSGVEREKQQTVFEVRVRLAEVFYWPQLTLAVRDARTRAHLEDVELRFVPTAYMGLVQQPGAGDPFTVVGEGLSSPIALRGGRKAGESEEMAAGVALVPAAGEALQPAELTQPEENARGVMMYARAPGHAWGRLVLDLSKGSERELFLHPGAALSLRLANVQLARYAELEKRATLIVRSVRPDGSEATVWSRNLDETLETDALHIEALEPGEHVVLVELSGSWQRKATQLGRETIFLPAGEARDLLLVVPDPPEPPAHATLAGVVAFPEFGGEQDVRLELYRSDYRYGDPDVELALRELQPVAAALPTWSFRLENLPVGRYQVRLLPFLKSWMIELPAGGRADVEFVIPELAEVLVETVDARSDELVPLESIAYRTLEVLPDQVTHGGSGPWSSVEFEGEPGHFRFWAAPGAVALSPGSSSSGVDYVPRLEQFELTPGLQSMRLELTVACTLRFEFRVDGAALPHEDGVFVGLSRCIRAVGHDGRVGGMYPYSLLQASAPGLYEISFEGVGADRFLPIPPRRIEARAGETTEVIVELRRR